MNKIYTFQDHLEESLKDPEFKKEWDKTEIEKSFVIPTDRAESEEVEESLRNMDEGIPRPFDCAQGRLSLGMTNGSQWFARDDDKHTVILYGLFVIPTHLSFRVESSDSEDAIEESLRS